MAKKVKEAPKPLTPAQKVALKKQQAKDKIRWKKDQERWKKEQAINEEKKEKALVASVEKYPLPEGIRISDLKGDYRDHVSLNDVDEDDYRTEKIRDFEIWNIGDWGWVIPTLLITKARYGAGVKDRTYAVKISDGRQVRVGLGPHVLASHKVHVKSTNKDRLKEKYLPIIMQGKVEANESRDTLSTRRMNSRNRYRFW